MNLHFKNIIVLAAFLIFGNQIFGQKLFFDRTVADCENRWIACPMVENGSYQFGFVFDVGEGLTFRMEGAFYIKRDSTFKRLGNKDIDPRPNLGGSMDSVALIPYDEYKSLNISMFPTWYEPKDTVVDKNVFQLYTEGLVFNRRGQYTSAIVPLEQAYKTNPDYKNLRLELAVTYNALGMHKKVIEPMQTAIKLEPKSYRLYQELAFAQLKLEKIPEAEKSAATAIKRCKLNKPRCQIALNLALHFYEKKNRRKVEKWLREARKYALDGTIQVSQIQDMLTEAANWPSY